MKETPPNAVALAEPTPEEMDRAMEILNGDQETAEEIWSEYEDSNGK